MGLYDALDPGEGEKALEMSRLKYSTPQFLQNKVNYPYIYKTERSKGHTTYTHKIGPGRYKKGCNKKTLNTQNDQKYEDKKQNSAGNSV